MNSWHQPRHMHMHMAYAGMGSEGSHLVNGNIEVANINGSLTITRTYAASCSLVSPVASVASLSSVLSLARATAPFESH